MSVFTDLKARGVEDIFIICSDNLTGLTQRINSIFPQAVTQICLVHQIRNSLRYVVWKDKKQFMEELKKVYQAPNREAAEQALEDLADNWGQKYGYAIKSWRANWENLTHFFDFLWISEKSFIPPTSSKVLTVRCGNIPATSWYSLPMRRFLNQYLWPLRKYPENGRLP